MNVIIKKCRQEIVGDANGMQITIKVEVDILHGNNLRVTTACSAAFHTKDGT